MNPAVVTFFCFLTVSNRVLSADVQDVELLIDNPYFWNPMIESSMTTMATRVPQEPNFFWSGSGDDPDAGMTYWITTTVYKTSILTLLRHSTTTTIMSTVLVSTTTTKIMSTVLVSTTSNPWNTTSPPIQQQQPESDEKNTTATGSRGSVQRRYWIQTVIQSQMDESSPTFENTARQRLARIYSDVLPAGSPAAAAARNSSSDPINVLIQNISRSGDDVTIVYALTSWNASAVNLVDAPAAVAALLDNARDFCRRIDDDVTDIPCRSVLTRTQAYLGGGGVTAAVPAQLPAWTIGVVSGAVVVFAILLIVLLVYLAVRKSKRGTLILKGKEDSPRPALSSSDPPSLCIPVTQSKTATNVTVIKCANVDSDGLPIPSEPLGLRTEAWLRKSRSTTKKDARHKRRPRSQLQTAVLQQRCNSSSNLPSITSTSSSEWVEYLPTREESMQASRSCRRLKKKSRHRKFPPPPPTSLPPNDKIAYSIVNISDPFDPAAAAAPQHQQKQRSVERRIRSNESTDDAGIQTITTISHIKTVERRRPATANPVARVSSDNYRSRNPRKIFSAPVRLSKNEGAQGELYSPLAVDDHDLTRKAWTSSSQDRPSTPEHQLETVVYHQSFKLPNEIGATAPDHDKNRPAPPFHHVHSYSFPTWPNISESDPAIQLIQTIQKELKRFDRYDY